MIPTMIKFALIMAGGAIGSLLRYLVQGWGQQLGAFLAGPGSRNAAFPIGTLLVNVIGCFLIGVLNVALVGRFAVREEYRIGLTVGVLGGFTTFSAFGWETFALANDGEWLRAAINIMLSLALGLGAVWLGYRLAERWLGVF